ncbi:hypothetical protein [Streptomyces sp. cg36]|uniref:hypothetical protein n=1 Tax=Streptomyces sp. cg36 TaxID=3238798 RepID=UPI0034E1CDBB
MDRGAQEGLGYINIDGPEPTWQELLGALRPEGREDWRGRPVERRPEDIPELLAMAKELRALERARRERGELRRAELYTAGPGRARRERDVLAALLNQTHRGQVLNEEPYQVVTRDEPRFPRFHPSHISLRVPWYVEDVAVTEAEYTTAAESAIRWGLVVRRMDVDWRGELRPILLLTGSGRRCSAEYGGNYQAMTEAIGPKPAVSITSGTAGVIQTGGGEVNIDGGLTVTGAADGREATEEQRLVSAILAALREHGGELPQQERVWVERDVQEISDALVLPEGEQDRDRVRDTLSRLTRRVTGAGVLAAAVQALWDRLFG